MNFKKLTLIIFLIPQISCKIKSHQVETKIEVKKTQEKDPYADFEFDSETVKKATELSAGELTSKILGFCGIQKEPRKFSSKRLIFLTNGEFSNLNLGDPTNINGDTFLDSYSFGETIRIISIAFNDTADSTKSELLCFDENGKLSKNQVVVGGLGFNKSQPDSYSSVEINVEYKSGKPLLNKVTIEAEDKDQTLFTKSNLPVPAFLDSKSLFND